MYPQKSESCCTVIEVYSLQGASSVVTITGDRPSYIICIWLLSFEMAALSFLELLKVTARLAEAFSSRYAGRGVSGDCTRVVVRSAGLECLQFACVFVVLATFFNVYGFFTAL